ncbi:MAG: hypothetical protein RLY35_1326 [Bacteroidota bacterium]|jgi:glycosyltransferase involved in cell wall biosynthesis
MNKVLFIAYQFPPMGGAGVRRSFQFVQNLPNSGYHPVVVTIESGFASALGKHHDHSPMNEINQGVTIHRLPPRVYHNVIQRLQYWRIYRLFWFAFYPLFWEKGALWPLFESKKIAQIGKDQNCKIVYTTSSPYFTIILGWWLKKKHGFKWVADIRDPFTDCYGYVFPSKTHWYIARKFEHWLLKKADHVIVNNLEVKKRFTESYGFSSEKITTIHNIIAHD